METDRAIKEMVREKYGDIARQSDVAVSCCGSDVSCASDTSSFAGDYSKLKGYNPDADLALGCGLPTQFANIKKGGTVVDLGSGAGNDCFVAREIVGATGKIIGIDMTPDMISKAEKNAKKLDLNNVEFKLADIESLPVASNTADVVVSNCVLNLVPDKQKAFDETFRILKPGGHFSISDIVTKLPLPESLQQVAALYTGCVAGALPLDEYFSKIKKAGFQNVHIQQEKKISLPDEILEKYLTPNEISDFKERSGILSITVFGKKPNS